MTFINKNKNTLYNLLGSYSSVINDRETLLLNWICSHMSYTMPNNLLYAIYEDDVLHKLTFCRFSLDTAFTDIPNAVFG